MEPNHLFLFGGSIGYCFGGLHGASIGLAVAAGLCLSISFLAHWLK